MRAAKKSKACHACAKGKRRCDKSQPICGRCDELDLECRYPQRRKRPVEAQQLPLSNGIESASVPDLDQLLAHADSLPQLQSLDPRLLEGISPTNPSAIPIPSSADSDWFLDADSWTISHLPSNIPPFSSVVFANYTRRLEAWLQQWVNDGHNPFIHRQLYAESGLPQCMRDAYASIAVHNTRTDANDTLVFQILEANAKSLVGSQASSAADAELDTRQHLARSQALFFHLAMALFSSPIRTRAQAERHIPLFMTWLDQLRTCAAGGLQAAAHPFLGHPASRDLKGSEMDAFFDGDAAPRLWRMWVVAESVRRIWLLGTMTVGMYLTLQRGWSKCNGGLSFTARRDIWAADSAVSWSALVKEQDPLFLPSLECGELFTRSRAPEVDEFAQTLLTVMYGSERVESWVARTTAGEDMLGLLF